MAWSRLEIHFLGIVSWNVPPDRAALACVTFSASGPGLLLVLYNASRRSRVGIFPGEQF